MLLRWFQKTGHRPITLMGGGTTKVGDPSGKDEMRKILSVEQIDANAEGIRTVFSRYITYGDGPTDSPLANNAEWLDELRYVAFLRDIGRHFTINRMLAFESVRARLDREQPLSFIEFNYMLLQSYDFLELFRRYGCILQMGGSDQWGNIVSGVDLVRRVAGTEVFGLTTPAWSPAPTAKKMGKSAEGAVWLNEDMMSSYEFWQWWRNVPDADVGKFLKLFTELPVDDCTRLGALGGTEIKRGQDRAGQRGDDALSRRRGCQRRRGNRARCVRKGRHWRRPADPDPDGARDRRRYLGRPADRPVGPDGQRQGGQAPDRRGWRAA